MREPRSNAGHPITFSRRAALKTLGAGLGAVAVWPYVSDEAAEAFALIQETKAPPALRFLTPAQYSTIDRFVEILIPADDHSPGAHDARVADYIDLLLSESDGQTQGEWTAGAAALDEESRRRFQVTFDHLMPAQAVELVTDMCRNERAPSTVLERFFVATKDAAIRGYYTSEIGIHKDLTYKGNRFLREFVGCTHPEHGYSGGSK